MQDIVFYTVMMITNTVIAMSSLAGLVLSIENTDKSHCEPQ